MQKRYRRIVVYLLSCAVLFSCIGGIAVEKRTEAKAIKTLKYTIKKGSTININKIINSSTLSKKKKRKAKKCTWKSNKKKIAKVLAGNKKIKGKKIGSTVIKGYSSKKKVYIRIKITVVTAKTPQLIRTTSKGQVKGKRNSDKTALIWYGIPYAATTAGENRFRAPQDIMPWTGVKNTRTMRKRAAQYSSSASGWTGTEDCLYVNVYRPNTLTKNLPVLVYLHGGGNCSGTANTDFADMAQATNSVIVSVSYRVGAFGFLSHPALQEGTAEEKSGNFAMLDIQKALQWVQTDIGQFGGNANNVTLSGFSGGARMVLLCLISPIMKGLFHKALVLSGGFTTSTQEEGKESVESKLAAILVNRGTYATETEAAAYIKSASNQKLKALFQSLTTAELAGMYQSVDLRMSEFPHGFLDGTVLPKEGFSVIEWGRYNRVPIMLGSDVTEFSSFGWTSSAELGLLSSSAPAILTERENYLVGTGIQYGSMLQSYYYIENVASALYGDAAHKDIYAFRMLWGTSDSVTDSFYSRFVGSYHGQSRDFLLGSYEHRKKSYSPDAVSTKNKKGRVALTKQMRSYIANFILTGNPNGNALIEWNPWNPVTGLDKIMEFNAKKNTVSSAMSSQMYNQLTIFSQLSEVTTEADYDILTTSLFGGRFFMPEVIPSYY